MNKHPMSLEETRKRLMENGALDERQALAIAHVLDDRYREDRLQRQQESNQRMELFLKLFAAFWAGIIAASLLLVGHIR